MSDGGLKRLRKSKARGRFKLEKSANKRRSMAAENGIVSLIIAIFAAGRLERKVVPMIDAMGSGCYQCGNGQKGGTG